jgi:tetratricopeptide (TPR) repeat protein
VRKAGDQIRITAQLIDARSDTHLWSETYDRELIARNIFEIQSQIAESISEALNTVLLEEDRNRFKQVPTQNLQAYEAYLLGRQRMTTRTREELLEASGYFEKAINLDQRYALAYVGLAEANLLLGNYGHRELSHALADAGQALSTALSLDDQLGAAYASLGMSRAMQGNFAGAEDVFRRAIALDPNYATSYHWYGDVLMNSFGQPAAAIPFLEKARELDPLSPVIVITLGESLYGVGEIQQAMALFRKAVEIEPEYPAAYNLIGMAYLDLGDDASAEYWIDRGMSMWPGEFSAIQAKIFLHRYRGEEAQALQLARLLLVTAPGNNASLVTLVNYGRFNEALETVAPAHPELSCEAGLLVTPNNVFPAMNLSLALQETGERECADQMLNKILLQLQEMPRRGFRSYGFLDVEVHARQGETQQALDALRSAIDEGWRRTWWAQLEGSPHMYSLLEVPEFKAMMTEIRADMSTQLTHVSEMEANGEMAPVPE